MSLEVLPSGVAAAAFRAALREFAGILGAENVISEQDRLASYRRIQLPVDEQEFAPSAAIMPESTDQLAKILAVSNKYKIPLWTISTGRNFGYGSAAPATRGQVVLDLRRMNKIISVDVELGTALVEPGVSYGQLQEYVDVNKLPLSIDMPGGGPIAGPTGNSLERGVGYTPYGDHWANVCGMEVMLADGTLVRTGMGGLKNGDSWQVFKYGYGPYLDGIFSQSNFAIVTKLGFWLMPRPEVVRTYRVGFDRAALPKAVEAIRKLKIANVLTGVSTLAHPSLLLYSTFKRTDAAPDGHRLSLDEFEAFARSKGLDAWNLIAGFYGPEEQVAGNESVARRVLGEAGGRFNPLPSSPETLGRSGLDAYGAYNWVGGGGSTWFAPVAPARGADATKQFAMADSILKQYGIDYIAAFICMGRDMHHVMHLLFDRSDPEKMKLARACFDHLLRDFSAAGYGVYRVATAYMDQVADIYGPEMRDLNRRIKRALDPNGILAPGKSGIHI